MHLRLTTLFLLTASLATAADPLLVGHRGLIQHAPENTLAGFSACLHLRVGFELDVHRTKDSQLVCMHDDDVKRTTNGSGKVSDMTLAELRKLDAGSRFDAAFAGERVPLLDEVFALLKEKGPTRVLVAIDVKIDDATVEKDIALLAKKHGVSDKLICIGRTISEPAVRHRFREADAKLPLAVLAQKPEDLAAALADKDADWAYLRFIPSREQVEQIHKAGKRVFLSGPPMAGNEPKNWQQAREAGVDGILTDYPLECRQSWRPTAK